MIIQWIPPPGNPEGAPERLRRTEPGYVTTMDFSPVD
jgi:hypothetical protein